MYVITLTPGNAFALYYFALATSQYYSTLPRQPPLNPSSKSGHHGNILHVPVYTHAHGIYTCTRYIHMHTVYTYAHVYTHAHSIYTCTRYIHMHTVYTHAHVQYCDTIVTYRQ